MEPSAEREPADLLLEADRVWSTNGAHRRNAAIAIRDGVIVGIGPVGEIRARFETSETRRYPHHLLMPGLINAHTHLAMTLLRGYAEGVELEGFLERVMAAEGELMDAPTVSLGVELAAVESLLCGVTTTLDMYFHPVEAHEAATRIGLRHIGGQTFLDFPGPDNLTWDERMAMAQAWPNEVARIGGPFVPVAQQPHGTYTVSPEHLTQIAGLAVAQDALIHIHASETEAENATVFGRYGITPVHVLEDAGAFDARVVIGHGVHLTDDDLATLARHDAAVVHCPVSNLKLASGMADIARLHSADVTVALGTDGCSSSNDLDLWGAMRAAALVASISSGSPAAVDAAAIVDAATRGGAAALGMGDRIGALQEGFEADVIVVDLDRPHLTPIHDLAALLVFAAGRSDVVDVFIAGRAVVRDREVLTADVGDITVRARARVAYLSR